MKWIEKSRDAFVCVDATSGEVVSCSSLAREIIHRALEQEVDHDGSHLPKSWLVALQNGEQPHHSIFANILYSDVGNKALIVHLESTEEHARSSALMQLVENNVAGIYEASLDGKLLSFNKAFEAIIGYDAEMLKSIPGEALYFLPEERHTFITDLRENGLVQNYELRYKRSDGAVAWCVENAFISKRGEDEIIVGTLTDITKQKLNEDRFQSLFFHSGDAIVLIEDQAVIKVNKRCSDLFGYSDQELLGKDIFALTGGLFHLSKGERELIEIGMRGQTGEAFRLCTLSQRKDGSQFHSEITMTRFETQAKSNLQVIIRDISERILHEEAIRESEERFRLLSEVAIEGVVFVVNEKIRDCNQQFANLFGFKRMEELLGKSIREFVGDHELLRLMETTDIKSLNRLEIRTKTRDGQVLFLEATGSKIEHRHEDVLVFLFYNITSRKRAEIALEQSTERFKSLVEHSPNGIFILTDGRVRYVNQSGLKLLEQEEEDDIFEDDFLDFVHSDEKLRLKLDLQQVRNGDSIEQREYKFINSSGKIVIVSLKATLTVYDGEPSIQVTLNNLNMRMKLMQETVRAQIAEEINVVLKKEIEEHKYTQKKLREAENFTRNIIQSSIDMIIAQDNKGKITEFNLAATKLFGYSPKEIVGKPTEVLYADKAQYVLVEEAMKKGEEFSGEIENVRKDGTRFTSFLSASVIRNDEGDPVGSMGVSRDVTELRKAERELRESEERYRDLFENASDFIFSVDANGLFLYANKAFQTALGYSVEEISKLKLDQVVSKLDSKEDWFSFFAGKTLEIDFRSKAGKSIKVYGDSTVRNTNGKPESVRAIYRDITDLRKHEQAALQQAAKLESIFNSTENMMMWTMDLSGSLNSYNNNFKRWCETAFSYQPRLQDCFLTRIKDWLDEDAYQGEMEHFQQVFTGQAQQFELPLKTTKGERIWFEVFANPVRVKDHMEEVSCLAYDVTDRKEIDQRVLASLKEKEVLLQEVHHRVKNNLQVISSILNLQSSFVTDDKVLSILKESQSRIKTMSYIHETLYQTSDFSSIEFTEYIGTLVRNLIQSYASQNTRVELLTDFDEIYLNLDQAIPCGLIINELVSNSLKYAFPDREDAKLTMRIKEEGTRIVMEVKDDGIGLPENFNVEESESLGIYLVHALVEQLDAEMTVTSKDGASFLITFEKQ